MMMMKSWSLTTRSVSKTIPNAYCSVQKADPTGTLNCVFVMDKRFHTWECGKRVGKVCEGYRLNPLTPEVFPSAEECGDDITLESHEARLRDKGVLLLTPVVPHT